MSEVNSDLDFQVRRQIYESILEKGSFPSAQEPAQSLSVELSAIDNSLHRLAVAHVLVLQPDRSEIMMAMPFSAIPTPFQVDIAGRVYCGVCSWDALGIAAMMKQDARIRTACGCCGYSMNLAVTDLVLEPAEGVLHFGVPAARWWDNIVFT